MILRHRIIVPYVQGSKNVDARSSAPGFTASVFEGASMVAKDDGAGNYGRRALA
jgi:hypothetical protein